MTAEIGLMNKQGVALAADSAVTLSGDRGPKIFSSANKIFALSKHEPVGVMVYGDAELLRTPWEVIIKEYRKHLGRTRHDSLEQYADHLLDYIGRNAELFPPPEQQLYFVANLQSYFRMLHDSVLERAEQLIARRGQVTEAQVAEIAASLVRDHWSAWNSAAFVPGLSDDHRETFFRTLGNAIERERNAALGSLTLTDETRGHLSDIAYWLGTRYPAFERSGGTGLIIAGFGERDVYPVMWTAQIYGVIHGQVHRTAPDITHVSRQNDAVLIPFAQSEMVHAFMRGTHPEFDQVLASNLTRVLTAYPDIVIQASGRQRLSAAAKRRLEAVVEQMVDDFSSGLEQYRRENHVAPTIDIVGSLPKDELAAMAESLVNLTSFRRRVSMDAETVGGPIDVAIISKGDGFVWIKRKHYFDPALNPQFFANYNS